ncbi:hypothetical protein ACM44_10000 [Chryseobacterium koreense CCUG 49689]|uniref:Uncharacterized protein n=1 Tax=Chryseobacterium koreense CCUG 49689 TaxID=1304281 RepID=A0A0J7IXE0_9FLAO|nr:hypothetical protein ACM44_10000 [Chryseobacterium koreense CCUG 49689]MBB5332397.1 hypothetical protein [Chryseobacterium koreense]
MISTFIIQKIVCKYREFEGKIQIVPIYCKDILLPQSQPNFERSEEVPTVQVTAYIFRNLF